MNRVYCPIIRCSWSSSLLLTIKYKNTEICNEDGQIYVIISPTSYVHKTKLIISNISKYFIQQGSSVRNHFFPQCNRLIFFNKAWQVYQADPEVVPRATSSSNNLYVEADEPALKHRHIKGSLLYLRI